MAPTVDGSAAVPGAVAVATRSLEVDARLANATPKSALDKLVVAKEQTSLLQVSEGVVRHVVRPSSPLVVPPATEEEDKVEEIEREESRPQAIRILCK